MYEKAVFKIIAMIVLIAFTVVSCSSPVNDEGDQADTIPTVPIGKGTPRFVYVDAGYDPAETDSGRTLLSIEDNEVAEGVAVIAEIPSNNPNNGSIVRVVNNNNQSVVSFFFRKNQIFPYQVVTQSEKGTVTGTFSLYNPADERYSIGFEKAGEGSCGLKKIYFNKDFFQVYKNQGGDQNTRLRHIVTALGVWDSIALQIPGKKFMVTEKHPGSLWDGDKAPWFQEAVADVFQAVPVVAFGAAVVRCNPEAVIVTFQTEGIWYSPTRPVPTIPDDALSVPTAATGDHFNVEDIKTTLTEAPPSPASPISPGVAIKVQQATVQNNGAPYDLLSVGDTIPFEIEFSGGYPVNDNFPWVNLFDPVCSEYSDLLHIISVAKTNVTANRCLLTIKKDTNGPIREDNGAGQAIIRFGCDIVINNSDAGVDFVSDADTTVPQHRNDVFIININTKPPVP